MAEIKFIKNSDGHTIKVTNGVFLIIDKVPKKLQPYIFKKFLTYDPVTKIYKIK